MMAAIIKKMVRWYIVKDTELFWLDKRERKSQGKYVG